jgi:hypothetical protein
VKNARDGKCLACRVAVFVRSRQTPTLLSRGVEQLMR